MKPLWLIVPLALALGSPAQSQHLLFRSADYTVTERSVRQSAFSATAHSDSELVSTYRSPYSVRTKRVVAVKFSMNGLDNERVPGQNHLIALPRHGGTVVSPVYTFGEPDSLTPLVELQKDEAVLAEDCSLRVRLDMRNVLRDLAARGFYKPPAGPEIAAADFHGVCIAGGTPPLSWNFSSLPSTGQSHLTDADSDGIYETTIRFAKELVAEGGSAGPKSWSKSKDLSAFPAFRSPFPLVNAVYAMSQEEMIDNIREDGAFMAGAMWPGVWTRDLSYSIILSLAMVHPDASRASLMAKVKDERIIQDTGTGGSWPVSSDRMIWAVAAWELYKVTGDRGWLKQSFRIIRNSADEDLHAVYDSSTGLFCGESSFLDWREQTYPRWMDPRDIYMSKTLGTNAVHYEALRILAAMADILGESPEPYRTVAGRVRSAMNSRFWLKERGYYGQFLYGRSFPSLSPRSEALGEALTVLFGIAGPARSREVVRSTPVTRFGIPCIHPQIPNIPPYHNDAVWPFVEAYWAWASARAGNGRSVEESFGSILRAAGLFLTNKENLVASTGDYMGTEINSSRQLWSVAGSLAFVHRILMGMEFGPDSLTFAPFVPRAFDGVLELRSFRYREALLDVTVKGFGNRIRSVLLDGSPIVRAALPCTLKGKHALQITLSNTLPAASITRVAVAFAPETPVVRSDGALLTWQPVKGAARYGIVRNGRRLTTTTAGSFKPGSSRGYAEYQVCAVDNAGNESFLSEPLPVVPAAGILTCQAEDGNPEAASQQTSFTGTGYIRLEGEEAESVTIPLSVDAPGSYSMQFRYANGNGPINTDNKCAIRTLRLDGKEIGVAVFPQRGADLWNDWGYSNPVLVRLSRGTHRLSLDFSRGDRNMNGGVNTALLDCVRLIRLESE